MFFKKNDSKTAAGKKPEAHIQNTAEPSDSAIPADKPKMRKLLTIEGMSCGHCVMRAESELREVAGVEDVSIELIKKSAMVTGVNLNDVALRTAVERAGYTVSRIIGSNQAE